MTVEEYNESVEKYSDGMYRFVLKNIKDEERARDIIQDTFEKLWMKLTEVSSAKVKSYLFTTAYHTMIDVIRKESRKDTFDAEPPVEHSHNEQYSDLQELLSKAIEKLPDKQRSVILLRDYEGYSYSEISEITGLSEAQVKVYIYRGRVFLKNYIGSMESVI
jgi:RNA polymerase sigma-70 factor (ECF subfamily)